MPKATLRLTIPGSIWIGAVSRSHPAATLHVLGATAGEDASVGLAELVAPNVAQVVDDVRQAEEVTDCTVLERDDGMALLQVETTHPVLLDPPRKSGVPLDTPFTVEEGTVTWEVVTSRDRLSELGKRLEESSIGFQVESVYGSSDDERLLTEQQLGVIEAAVKYGYYDTPRTCTQEELAAKLDIAKSTCSQLLHRAEEQVVKQFVGGFDETPDQSPRRAAT